MLVAVHLDSKQQLQHFIKLLVFKVIEICYSMEYLVEYSLLKSVLKYT